MGLCHNVSQIAELVRNWICHSRLCHDLLEFNWDILIVWDFVFLQRHDFSAWKATKCFLEYENSIETNLLGLYLWINTCVVLNELCFCFARKHCITYRYGYLHEEAYCVIDVKKWLQIMLVEQIPKAFLHTPFGHKSIWNASQVT